MLKSSAVAYLYVQELTCWSRVLKEEGLQVQPVQRLPGAAAGHMLLCFALACYRTGLLWAALLSRIKFSCCEQEIKHCAKHAR